MVPVECVARGYLAGSGLAEYTASGSVCGVPLPAGLVDGSRLPEPIFTPATKAAMGDHDENVSYDEVAATVGTATAAELRKLTLDVYARAQQIATERGIIVADTKLEFGWAGDGNLVLADEVLTPDSSRFWPAAGWRPGGTQPSYDKQFVRDWLTSPASGWDRASGKPPPPLPDEVVAKTRGRATSRPTSGSPASAGPDAGGRGGTLAATERESACAARRPHDAAARRWSHPRAIRSARDGGPGR